MRQIATSVQKVVNEQKPRRYFSGAVLFPQILHRHPFHGPGIQPAFRHNRAITNQEIIQELINIAHKLREAANRGEDLGLTDDEICFYDALIQNNSAQELMQDDQLKVIATELVMTVRKNVSIDWTLRETARSRIRVIVKRILRKFGYPPDLQDAAVRLVLEQAETLSDEWAKHLTVNDL